MLRRSAVSQTQLASHRFHHNNHHHVSSAASLRHCNPMLVRKCGGSTSSSTRSIYDCCITSTLIASCASLATTTTGSSTSTRTTTSAPVSSSSSSNNKSSKMIHRVATRFSAPSAHHHDHFPGIRRRGSSPGRLQQQHAGTADAVAGAAMPSASSSSSSSIPVTAAAAGVPSYAAPPSYVAPPFAAVVPGAAAASAPATTLVVGGAASGGPLTAQRMFQDSRPADKNMSGGDSNTTSPTSSSTGAKHGDDDDGGASGAGGIAGVAGAVVPETVSKVAAEAATAAAEAASAAAAVAQHQDLFIHRIHVPQPPPPTNETERVELKDENPYFNTTQISEEKHRKQHPEKEETFFKRVKEFVKKFWFPLGIPVMVMASLSFPNLMHPRDGILQSGQWRDYLIPGMFFASGLSVPVNYFLHRISAIRIHFFIQALSFVVCPLLGAGIVSLATQFTSLREEFAVGLLFASCLPTTIGLSTAVARALNVNVPLTIINSVLGNVIGIVATPYAFQFMTGYKTNIDANAVIEKLAYKVVAPLLFGLSLRALFFPISFAGDYIIATMVQPYLAFFQQFSILTFLSTVVSANAMTVKENVRPSDIPLLLATVVVMYTVFFHVGMVMSRFIPMKEPERVAALLNGTQKTAAMGVSIITLVFANDPVLPLVTFPLLCYHTSQVFLSAVFASNAMKRGWCKGIHWIPHATFSRLQAAKKLKKINGGGS